MTNAYAAWIAAGIWN